MQVLAYLAIAFGGAAWWWRFGRDRSDQWIGPASRHWALARRLALCGRFGATVACVGVLLLVAILVVAGRTHDAVAGSHLAIIMFPGWMLLHIIAGALNGPSSSAGSARQCLTGSGKGDTIRYVNRDWFQLVLGPVMLVGFTGFLASVAVVPALNTETLPLAVCWGLAAVLLLGLAAQLGSAVVRAEVEGGRVRGRTMLCLRRFDYDLGRVQISYRTMLLPSRELLLVSHMGWWPVVFSSKATGYERLSSTLDK